MARIRTVKPSFFRHAGLFDAEKEFGLPLRLAFEGLWTAADREGRFKWEPRELKLDCLPFDDVDFSRVLEALAARGFIKKYEVGGNIYGYVPSWHEHQQINIREAKSKLPAPPIDETHVHAHACTETNIHVLRGVNIPSSLRDKIFDRDNRKCVRCGSTEDLTIDLIFPQSLGGTHAETNLRTLCRGCNSCRPVAGPALDSDLARDGLTLKDMKRMCMHVRAQGEGKGREEEGKRKDAANAASEFPDNPEADLFRRGKEILGQASGGLIKQLLRAKNNSIPLARAALEQASTKQDAREYIGAIVRGRDSPEDLRARGEAW